MDGNGWLESMSFMLTDWLMLVTAAAYYAVLLAAVVLVVNVLFRRWISAGQMALLWGLVLLRLVVPVVPSSPLSLESLLQPAEQASETRNTMPATPGNAIAIANPASDSANALSETAATKAASKAPEESNWEMVISDSVPLVWMLVGVCGLGYTVAGYVWFRRRVARVVSCSDERILRLWAECCERANVKRTGRIVQFDGIDQPAVMGVFRPTLLLPTNGVKLDDEQLRMVMLHELAHVRRWDVAGNWALVFVRVIHWWNPVYWMAAARYRSLREQACDAFVVRKLEGQSAHGYGELLLALAARRPTESKWRVMLSASILSFFPLRFRRRAVQVRLSALRRAHVRHGRWQAAIAAILCLLLVASGFTVAREEGEKSVDLATWMASHPEAVLATSRNYIAKEDYVGPLETREYDVAKVLKVVREEAESSLTGVKVESKLGSEELLEITLKQMLGHVRTGGDASRSKHSVEEGVSVGVKDVERASTGSLPLAFKVTGTTLSATAPASLHETLRRMLDAWGESGMAQITLETRFLSSNRDLVSDLGVSWQFVEAFSAERENIFPSIRHESATVVRAEASVDEYLPLVVSTLNEQQQTKLLNLAYGERHSNVLNAPKVTIFNGMEATIADCSQRPFVVGVFERAPGVTQPKVVVLEEGTKIKIHAVVGRDRKQVHIAASLDMRSVGDVTTASTSFRGAPVTIQVPSVNRRTIDVAGDIESGQTLLVGFIPTGKQKQYLYYLMSARTISESGVVANTATKDTK